MKKIGFVDYYLSEWHANHYPEWINQACKRLGLEYTLAYAWAELDISPIDGISTDEWCERFGAQKCLSIKELCDKSDVIIVLSPSDPDKHLGYAREVFKSKKRTYIDKTFAPDYKTAEEIFALARENGADFFSSSALRYADELSDFTPGEKLVISGGGSNIAEYIIHQAEMAVKLYKSAPVEAHGEKTENGYKALVSFENGKQAEFNYMPGIGFSVSTALDTGETVSVDAQTNTFDNLIADILCFFETGKHSFDPSETLLVMKLRDAILDSIK
ncbi:MAG: hypothetical protein J6V93_02735 [Clostridia bacterium]|nr:hypothetical protein [Clostridia bacterium]